MKKLVEDFRRSLQGKQSIDDTEESKALFSEAKEIGRKLREYKLGRVSISYLASSELHISTYGVEASRRNIRLDKVPVIILRQLVELARKTLSEKEKQVDDLLMLFPTGVAEICFDNSADSKSEILKKLVEKKQGELTTMCNSKMIIPKSIRELRIELQRVAIRFDAYFSGNALSVVSINTGTQDFLTNFENIKLELIETLDSMFKTELPEDKIKWSDLSNKEEGS